ncbi:MAG: hypothetical protein OXC03_09610 [Flavobacteriaceae bacterium]|nr:hypothetical protein [Flavobacteriaceae bacterium]
MLHLALGTLPLNEVSPPRDDDRMIHVMSHSTEGIKPYWYGSKKDVSSKVTVGNGTFSGLIRVLALFRPEGQV